MNLEKIILFASLVLFNACNSKKTDQSDKRNLKPIDIRYEIDTLKIPVDDKTLAYFKVYSNYNKEGNAYLMVADDYNHRLLNINLDDEKIENTIDLDLNGQNGVGDIEGLYFHNSDSIFIYERLRIKLINSHAEVKRTYDLTQTASEQFGFLYTNNNFQLIYNKASKCIFLNNIFKGNRKLALKYPAVAKLNVETGDIKLLNIYYSDYIKEKNGLFNFQFKLNLNAADENHVYYTFPVESNIYSYNLSTRHVNTYEAPSKNTPNFIQALPNLEDIYQGRINFMENPYFYGVFFDKKNQLFYRIHREGKPFDITNERFNVITDVNFYISVFDKDFNYIKEIELPKNTYIQYSWFCSNGALYLSASNPKYDNFTDEIMEIHRYKFEVNR